MHKRGWQKLRVCSTCMQVWSFGLIAKADGVQASGAAVAEDAAAAAATAAGRCPWPAQHPCNEHSCIRLKHWRQRSVAGAHWQLRAQSPGTRTGRVSSGTLQSAEGTQQSRHTRNLISVLSAWHPGAEWQGLGMLISGTSCIACCVNLQRELPRKSRLAIPQHQFLCQAQCPRSSNLRVPNDS